MGYPAFVNWATIKKTDDGRYIIRDFNEDKEYRVSPRLARFARQLDGKRNPYEITSSLSEDQVTEYLKMLDEAELLRTGRVKDKHIFGMNVTLWIPKVTDGLRIFSWFANAFIMISWLPALICGIYGMMNCWAYDEFALSAGGIIGLLVGIAFHELGHMFAALGYGGRVFELGVMLSLIMPGAYTMIDLDSVKKRFRKLQMYAAGVESNFLLAGIAGVLAMYIESFESFFFSFACINIVMGVMNLTFSDGIDGFRMFEEILGTKNLFTMASRVRKSRSRRRFLIRKGMSGVASVAVCYMLGIFRFLMPISFVAGLIEVIRCFI